LAELTSSPLPGITVALEDESNLLKWKVTMEGPAGSPYAVSSSYFEMAFLRPWSAATCRLTVGNSGPKHPHK
jgi:ubiquitin-protein ligase